jgi:hypothetical protein
MESFPLPEFYLDHIGQGKEYYRRKILFRLFWKTLSDKYHLAIEKGETKGILEVIKQEKES